LIVTVETMILLFLNDAIISNSFVLVKIRASFWALLFVIEYTKRLFLQFHFFFFRWSLIAGRIPGRTDNQVKNHWNTHLSIKLGVKKGKSKISSSKFSKKIEASFNTKLSSNERLIPSNKTETELQNVIEDSHEKEIEITSTHEPILTSDCYENFWLFNDDSYLFTPSLMELLDESLESFMA